MEEILASIRRIIADDQEDDKQDQGSSEPVKFPIPAARPEPSFTFAADLPRFDAEPAMSSRPSLDIEMPDLSFGEPTEDRFEPRDAGLSPAAQPLDLLPRDRAPTRDGLISTSATESVGRAFNMLSHTVLSGSARTLEDLVKEMLTPMLQGWLDDHLPPLVERLVKDEIERVARGRT